MTRNNPANFKTSLFLELIKRILKAINRDTIEIANKDPISKIDIMDIQKKINEIITEDKELSFSIRLHLTITSSTVAIK